MCWRTSHTKKMEPVKVHHDTVVYKMIVQWVSKRGSTFITPIRQEPVLLGQGTGSYINACKVNHTTYSGISPIKVYLEIEEGIHCYSPKAIAKVYRRDPIKDKLGIAVSIERTTFTSLCEFSNSYILHIVKCVVPKGSVLYVNEKYEAVADCLLYGDKAVSATVNSDFFKKGKYSVKMSIEKLYNKLCVGEQNMQDTGLKEELEKT